MHVSSLRGSPISARASWTARQVVRFLVASPAAARRSGTFSRRVVHVWLVVRAAPVHVIEIEGGRAEIDQGIGIILLLQAASRIECEVVIDELSQIRVKSGNSALLGIDASLASYGTDTMALASAARLARLWSSSAPKVAAGRPERSGRNAPGRSGIGRPRPGRAPVLECSILHLFAPLMSGANTIAGLDPTAELGINQVDVLQVDDLQDLRWRIIMRAVTRWVW